tara:strand:+ start:4023 stop:4691 length:669 start_codon:yes stop_codon:yes gene_type:complete
MYKKRRAFFVTFEGIEGSGKSFQSNKLFKNLVKKKIPVVYTREPGGTKAAERIRKLILEDYFYSNPRDQFDKNTDTLLYLAARNEHIRNKIKPAISKKKIVICDRFTDSTLAYQVYGKAVNRSFVNSIHKHILKNITPNLTFVLKVKISKALKRLKKRKKKNRYDKFSKNFYNKVQRSFIKIAKSNKKRYIVLDSSVDTPKTEKIIYEKFMKVYKNEKRKKR